METFYITFNMNDGQKIEIQEENDSSYDFLQTLKSSGKWFKSGYRIINLDNVNSVMIETTTSRQEDQETIAKAFQGWNQ